MLVVSVDTRVSLPRDPADAIFIAAALAAKADWLVTLDRDLLELTGYDVTEALLALGEQL